MRRVSAGAIALLILSVLSFPTFLNGIIPKANATSASFSFGASGDIGSLTVSTSINSLNRLSTVNPNFFLGLGDFSYNSSVTGGVWCSQFKSSFSNIEIFPGDHDTGGHNSTTFGETHSYERYVSGCALTLGVNVVCGPVQGACYGKEYYFDYPAANPIARFVFVSPKIYNITGVCTQALDPSWPGCSSQTGQPCTDQYGCWQYVANDIHYNWTASAIDDAHAKGIGWVIVGSHKLCISSADATCSMGIQLFNMLLAKKVDLIIQAHDNAYERSTQLALNPTSCPKVSTDGNGYAVYNSGCVVNSSTGNYTRGLGTIVVVQGAWVNDLYGVNASASTPANVAEAPYFAKLMGKNTPGNGLGFVKYTVSDTRIDVQTSFSGSFSDTFSIANSINPLPVASWSPLAPQVGQTTTFTATASGGAPPYSFSWNFGDGGQATGTTVTHSYAAAGYYNVTLTAKDSANHSGSSRSLIPVGSWNPAVTCVPTQSTIEQVIGKVSIQRNATIPSSIGADYSGGGFKLAGNLPYGSNPDNWPYSKRALQPPCAVNGIPTFVELHNVTLTRAPSTATYDCRNYYSQANGGAPFPNGKNCDTVLNIGNASATTCPSCYMHEIYAEIDGDWNASGVAPTAPPLGQMIDVQGFIYWDPDSGNQSSHNWSGWELHTFTAWRLAVHVARSSFAVMTTFDGRIYNYLQNGTVVFGGKPVGSALRQVAWRPDGSYALIVGDQGVVYTYDGSVLTRLSSTVIGSTNLNTVAWKPDGSYALIGGQNGLIFTYNGTAFTKITDPATKNIFSISWNPSGNSALIVGDSGTALMYTVPGKITLLSSGTGQPLFADAWNPGGSYALAAGGNGVVLLYNGTSFKTVSTAGLTPTGKNVRFIAFNANGSLGILAGDSGLVWTYNGAKLASLASGTNNNLFSLSWLSGSAYIVGQNGILLSYSGGTLKTLSSGTNVNFASISFKPQPISASFTYSPSNPSAQTPIFFNASANGGTPPYGFSWNFGDGTLATGENVVHTYSSTGSFMVTVIVTDNAGAKNQTTRIVTVQPSPPPVVTVNSPAPNPAITGATVNLSFAVSSSTTISGIAVNWGDGTAVDFLPGTATTDTHVYASTGAKQSQTFTITVSGTNAGGSGSGNTTEAVNDRPPAIALSSVSPNPATTGQPVTLNFTVTDPDGTIASVTVNWGDGSVDNLPGTVTSDVHTYASAGSFTITIVATDNSGSTGHAAGSVTVQAPFTPPTVTINGLTPNPVNTDATVSVSFTVTSSATVSGITVNWGDGTADNLAGTAVSDSHVYSSTGNAKSKSFTVTVSATNSAGSGSETATETVNDLAPFVTVSNLTSPVSTGQTANITFSASDADGTVSLISINWGDGTTADILPGTATADTHGYPTTGNSISKVFTITITATDNSGSTVQTTTSLTVNDRPPIVNVTSVSPNPTLAGQAVTVSFSTSDPDGTVSSITVNWGDGSPSDSLPGTSTSDTHTYPSGGNFTISVTAVDNSGSSGAGAISVSVAAPLAPTVTISSVSPNPASTRQTVTVTFTVSSTTGVSGVTVNWGDGTTDSLAGTATSDGHAYASTGSVQTETFKIVVTATNAAGSGSAVTNVAVDDQPPAVALTGVSPNPASPGATVTTTFTSTDNDGTVASISVNWGDGTSSDILGATATSDTHSYSSPGSYTITITATDNSGSTSQTTGSVTVQTAPTVTVNNPAPNPANTGAFVSLTFTVTSSSTVTGITVNWGDGTTDNLASTATTDTHAYASTGASRLEIFTIIVSATNVAGTGSGTTTETVDDRPPAVSILSVAPSTASTGQTVAVSFSAADSDGTVASITVNWGDGYIDSLSGSAVSDTHTYASTGNSVSKAFTITVTATDNSGSTGSAVASATINDRPPTITVTGVSPNPSNTGQVVTVTFTASDPDGAVSSVTVNWGDGAPVDNLAGTSTSDTHTYSTAGNFTITIVATDNSGSTPQVTASATVTNPQTLPYALAVTADGKVYKTYTNGTMVLVGQPVTTELRAISWKPDGSYALISGDSAVLLKYDGTSLTSIPTGIATGYNFWTVSWKPDGTYALIGGTSGLLLKYDGVSVTTISDPNTLTIFAISWNPTSNYALMVGKSGSALTYDGTSVRSFTSGAAYDLDAIGWNPNGQYALIGGLNGTILRFNGTQIRPINTNGLTGTNAITSIVFNPTGTLALLVGNNGMILTYNGTTLTLLGQVTYSWLYCVSWSPSGTAYIVGNGGTELTYSNGTLTKVSSGTTSGLRAISWKPQ
jgi:PKD repeat protein